MSLSDILPNLPDELSIPEDDAKYRLIKSYMPGLVQRDYNQTEARRAFRASGFRFTDQRFNQIYNEVKQAESRFSTLRSLEAGSYIERQNLIRATRPLTGDVRLVANFDVDDETISQRIRGSFSLDLSSNYFGFPDDSDYLASVEDAEDEIIRAISERYGIEPQLVQNIRIMYGFTASDSND